MMTSDADEDRQDDRDERQRERCAPGRLSRRSCSSRGRRRRLASLRSEPFAGPVVAATSRPPVAISRPTSFLSAVRPSHGRDELAAVDDRDPVGQLEDLVELGRHEQDRGPGVALGDRLLVDELDAADVEAAGRLVEDEQLQVAAELAGDDDLLLVAARQRRRPSPPPRASGCRTP